MWFFNLKYDEVKNCVNENIKNISCTQAIDAFYTCVYLPNLNREGFGGNLDSKNSALIHIQIIVLTWYIFWKD